MSNNDNNNRPARPSIGQSIDLNRRGTFIVRRVYALGTCDVECLETGTWHRVTGLGWA